MKRLSLCIAFILLLLLCSSMLHASAATEMNITSHDSWEVVSYENSFKLRWDKVTGASGYWIAIKDNNSGEYYVQNEYTTKTYYTATNDLPEKSCTLKIWVGAVTDSSVEPVNSFTSEIIYVMLGHEPAVTIGDSSSVTDSSAVLEMSVDKDYSFGIEDCGFYVGKSSKKSSMTKYSFWDYSTSYGADTKGTKYMTIPDLEPGTKYYYRAYAENAAGEEYTDYEYFTTAKGSLGKPVITYPENQSTCYTSSDLKLQWNSVSGAESYKYYIKQLKGEPNTNDTDEPYVKKWDGTTSSTSRSYTLKSTDLTPGYWYKFVVEACADGASSGWSAWHYVYVEKGNLEKAKVVSPKNTASYTGYKSILFDWDPVDGATSYNYYVKRLAGVPDSTNTNEPSIGTPWTGTTTTTSYTLAASNVIPGSWYKFVVEATSGNANPSWSEWVYCYIEAEQLGKPEINTPTEWTEIYEGESVVVDWDNVTGADGYRVHIKQLTGKPDTSNTNEPAVSSIKHDCGTTSKYTLSSSKVHGGYWYKFVVEAYTNAGTSTWSNWVYVYVQEKGALDRAVISAPSDNGSYEWGQDILFTWTKVPNATTYTYYIKQLKGEPDYSSDEAAIQTWTGTTSATKRYFTLPGNQVLPDMWYKFVVKAEGDGYDSSWSKYTYIHIPDREDWTHAVMTGAVSVVFEEAFASNTNLRTFDASNSQLTTIGARAFENCVNLRSIFLPASVTSIADNTFTNCSQLTIHCYKDSYAHQYAVSKNIPFVLYGVVEQTDVLKLSRTSWNINFSEAAQTVIQVSSSGSWKASSSATWLKPSVTSGGNGANVILKASKNTGNSSRTATVTFTCGKAVATVSVTQSSVSGEVCSMVVKPTHWEPASSNDLCKIVVQSKSGFTVSSNNTWLRRETENNSINLTVTASALKTAQEGVLTITCKECGAKQTVTVAIKTVSAPTGVSAEASEPHAIELSWNEINGATYIVERSPNGVSDWKTIASGISGNKYTDGDSNVIGASSTHHYRITACKNSVNSAPSNVVSATTRPEEKLVFTGKVGNLGDNERTTLSNLPTLSWSSLDGATYKLTLKDVTTNTYVVDTNGKKLETRDVGAVTSKSLSGLLTEGHDYLVWVGAFNDAERLIGQTDVKGFGVISANAALPTITVNSIKPASVSNSGNAYFGISFTATNASTIKFDFGNLIVQEKWDKDDKNHVAQGEKSVWTFDGGDIGTAYSYDKTTWTANFYPKATITPGTYTVKITVAGDGGEKSVTKTITIEKVDTSKYKQNQDKIVAHADSWLSTRFKAYGVHYYMKSATYKTVTDSTLYYHGMPYVGGGKDAKLSNGTWVQDGSSGYNSHGIRQSITTYKNLSDAERQTGVDTPYWYSGHATTSAYYGNECMGFVAQCWRAADSTIHSWVSLPNFVVDKYSLNYYRYAVDSVDDLLKAEPGDALQTDWHIILVVSNQVADSTITIIEQTASPGGFKSCQCEYCKNDPTLRSLGTRQTTYSYSDLIKEGYFAIIRIQECMSPDKTAGWTGHNLK